MNEGIRVDAQCCYIRRESGKAQKYPVGHGEDLYRRNTDECQEALRFTTTRVRTFVKLDEMPNAWFPSRKSEAMATHSFPTMAITEPPLYSIIDCKAEDFSIRARGGARAC